MNLFTSWCKTFLSMGLGGTDPILDSCDIDCRFSKSNQQQEGKPKKKMKKRIWTTNQVAVIVIIGSIIVLGLFLWGLWLSNST